MQTGRMDMQRMVSGKEKTKRYGFNASGTMEKRGLPGGYVLTLYMQPSNPVANDQKLCYGVQNNGGEIRIYNAVPEGYRIGDQGEFWAKGVLDQIRRQEIPVSCRSGINRLRIYSVTPGFVLEKLLIRPEGTDVPESYLGPKETYHT